MPRPSPSRHRASLLAFTLITITALSLVLVSLMNRTRQERTLTRRRAAMRESVNAVESTLNYGIAQIINRVGDTGQIRADFLDPVKGAALIPPPADLLSGSYCTAGETRPELLGGYAYAPKGAYAVPIGDPTTITDPLKGMSVTSRTVPLLAAVTARVNGDTLRTYAKCDLIIRDVGLFSYAIFYNDLNMEIGPGGPMVIAGPVRSNQNALLGGNSKTDVRFLGTLHVAGRITGAKTTAYPNGVAGQWYVPFKDTNANGRYDATPGWVYDRGDMFRGAAAAELTSLWWTDGTGTRRFIDSRAPDWTTLGTLASNGNMQDSAHGVTPVVPAGLPSTAAGSSIIRPPLTPADPGYDESVEATKYANKAGLYLVVEPDGGVTGFQSAADALRYKAVTHPNAARQRDERDAWKTANADKVLALPDLLVSSTNPGTTNPTSSFYDRREDKTVNTVDLDVGLLRSCVSGASGGLVFRNGKSYALDTPGSAGWNGVVYLDVEAPNAGWLKTKANEAPTSANSLTAIRAFNAGKVPDRAATNAAAAPGFTLATNTALYTVGHVNADGDLATGSATAPDSGKVAAPGEECAVCLAADAVTLLSSTWQGSATTTTTTTVAAAPAPGTVKHADGSSTTTTVFANADGTYSVTTATTRPTARAQDPTMTGPGSLAPNAVFTEVSAALMTGIVPTASTSAKSGGVENFPRLLENWESNPADWTPLTIRGSLVAMYKSSVATGAFKAPVSSDSRSVYTPPTRNWGFAQLFQQGTYPPGSPVIRNYRRMNFRVISAAEFERERSSIWELDDGSGSPKYPPS